MRICGKRASQFTQEELWLMKKHKMDFNGEKLTPEQVKEIDKVYKMRKGANTSGPHVQGRV